MTLQNEAVRQPLAQMPAGGFAVVELFCDISRYSKVVAVACLDIFKGSLVTSNLIAQSRGSWINWIAPWRNHWIAPKIMYNQEALAERLSRITRAKVTSRPSHHMGESHITPWHSVHFWCMFCAKVAILHACYWNCETEGRVRSWDFRWICTAASALRNEWR